MSVFRKKEGKISDAQAYLRSTDNVSRPTAILMSFVAFLAVFAVVFSLFLGGRWVYDRFQNGTNDSDTQQITGGNGTTTGSDNTGNGLEITVVDGSGELTASAVGSEVNNQNSANNTQPAATVVAGTNVATESLPNTGPANTLLIVLGAVVIGTVAHSAYQRNNG